MSSLSSVKSRCGLSLCELHRFVQAATGCMQARVRPLNEPITFELLEQVRDQQSMLHSLQ